MPNSLTHSWDGTPYNLEDLLKEAASWYAKFRSPDCRVHIVGTTMEVEGFFRNASFRRGSSFASHVDKSASWNPMVSYDFLSCREVHGRVGLPPELLSALSTAVLT